LFRFCEERIEMNWIKTLVSLVLASPAVFAEQTLNKSSAFMPTQATDIARQYDQLYSFIVWASAISCVILIGGMIYFAFKYKRKSDTEKTPYISHNHFLEFLWSFIPLVIFLAVFAWGWWLYHQMRQFPENAMEVHVTAKQWAWDFQYKSGKISGNEFVVPVNTPVKLIMTSVDVLHSFYIPSMRIKQDVVPGRYTALWFNAEKMGDYHIFCTEFCGAAHSAMLAKVRVVPMAEYEAWLQENDEGLTLAQRGEKLYNSKGCVACHSVDGSQKVGPSWKGVWGASHEMSDGSKVTVDENYIRESIVAPNAKVVKGFAPGVMPSYQGQVSDQEISALIEYMKTLK
jgi:cytochrome c oxidase subunit II